MCSTTVATSKVYKHMHMQLYTVINGLLPENKLTVIVVDAYLETRIYWIRSIGKHSNLGGGGTEAYKVNSYGKNLIPMEKL